VPKLSGPINEEILQKVEEIPTRLLVLPSIGRQGEVDPRTATQYARDKHTCQGSNQIKTVTRGKSDGHTDDYQGK
jgi:hypothetical protein